jgi:hypothetical protein
METPSSGTITPVDLENAGPDGSIQKRLTVTFRDLNVRVTAPDAALGSTLWSAVDPRQLGDLFSRKENRKRVNQHDVSMYGALILTISIDNFEGCIGTGQAWRNGRLHALL